MPINLKDSTGTGYTAVSAANPLPVTIAGGGSSSITTVGALNSGSITSGFGSIDIGADSLTAGAISGTTGTFSGALTQNAGATNGLITLNSDNTTSGFGSLRIRTGASKTAWQISAQNNVDNGLEITPSTAAGGTTFTTPVFTLTSTGLSVTGTVSTTDPAGGAGPAWKLGVAASVSPTFPNRTIRIDIGGTSYYLAAKTTND